MLVDAALRVNELTLIFTENMLFEELRLVVRLPFTKEKQAMCWTTIVFYCSCLKLETTSIVEANGKEELNAKSRYSDAPEQKKSDVQLSKRRGACSFCTTKSYFSNKVAQKRREKVEKVSYNSPEGEKKGTPFFVTHKAKATPASIDTLKKDVIQAMKKANIASTWSAHSIRAATASKVRNLGVNLQRTLDFGRWASADTFVKHYFRREFYKEESAENDKKPIWWVIRSQATPIEAPSA